MAESSNDLSRMIPPPQPNPKWLSQQVRHAELVNNQMVEQNHSADDQYHEP